MKILSKPVLYITLSIFLFCILFYNFIASGPAPTGNSQNIIITEFMPSNKSTIADSDGEYSDWIELYNSGNSAVNLRGFSLSDSEETPIKMKFPDFDLGPGEYLVVFASGKNKSAPKERIFHTDFKLSPEDKFLILSFGGKLVDKLEIKDIPSDNSLIRKQPDSNEITQCTKPTPGFENSDKGYLDFLESKLQKNSPLLINEFMSLNKTTLRDEDWDYPDWIEILNSGNSPINLKGYTLSDDTSSPKKWGFPDIEIRPGEYLTLFASGKDKMDSVKKMYHTNFKLDAEESIIISSPDGKVLDSVKIPKLPQDTSLGRKYQYPGIWLQFTRPTPGHQNDGKGYNSFTGEGSTLQGIVLNEALPLNFKGIKDEDGAYSDWVEIYNPGSSAVGLAGYYLSDDADEPLKWKFPAGQLNPDKRLLIYLSGKNKTGSLGKPLHTNFKLDNTSEAIYLSDSSGRILDKLTTIGLPPGVSCGKPSDKGGYVLFDNPSPMDKNSPGFYDISGEPRFNKEGGFYQDKFTLTLEPSSPEATMHYTLDGSIPDKNSLLYTAPIPINKTTVVRARSYTAGMLPGSVKTSTYFINPRNQLPVISIATAPENFWDENNGLYTKGKNASSVFPYQGANFWKDIEKPIHIEFYETDGKQALSMDAGIKIFGAYSRAMDQKSFSILARKEYGKSTIDYQFFKNLPIDKFNNIVLRTSGQDATMSKIRDPMMTRLASDMGLDVQAYRPAVLYVNGEYFGLYNIREKTDEYYAASHHNIDNPASIDILEANGRIKVGDNSDYKALIDFVSKNDLRNPKNFEYVKSQMDIKNYMNYHIAEMYFANTDAGNIRYWREDSVNGRWRWIVFDTDWGFFNVKHNTVAFALNPAGTGVGKFFSTELIRSLMENQSFKEDFLRNFALQLNTNLKAERVVSIIDEMAGNIEPEMPYQLKRWGGSMSGWRTHIDKLRNFARERPKYLYTYIKDYFKLTDGQMKEYGFTN